MDNNMQERITASFNKQGLMDTLGARLTLVQAGEVHITLPFSAHLSQQHGYLHAGAVTSIVDVACGYAALTMAPEGYEVVTAEFKINLLRPALGPAFVAIGKVQNAGKLLTVCTGEVRRLDDDGTVGKAVALIQATIVNVAISG
ncbi:putative thioesterase superfamily protein [Advenella mimigardefordensis DPN7]|uniref:Putative thioesterase superfamily protein n=2 Tax=Advenella mimigardefordensis TaxID=302406 RepID=W0PEL8_ADVMD|nr:PaaI family thioesterase [Advenella mimigardefordensis]AHG63690.1 putative thioesterase superfamily protein [Advenella mimigardefordensis DPN7]